MPRHYTFHDKVSHPDEWFCSKEQKWKPRSEFNLRDEANGLPQWDCRDCQQKRGRDRYNKHKDQVKNINRVAKLNSREENREYVYNYLYTHRCRDCGASDPRILTFDHVQGTKKGNVRWWVGRDNATLSEPTSSHAKCLKTRRLPPVGCTLCWAAFNSPLLLETQNYPLNAI